MAVFLLKLNQLSILLLPAQFRILFARAPVDAEPLQVCDALRQQLALLVGASLVVQPSAESGMGPRGVAVSGNLCILSEHFVAMFPCHSRRIRAPVESNVHKRPHLLFG